MSDPMVEQVMANPKYLQLLSKRAAFGWTLTALMMVVYFGYILLIAFDKDLLARKVGAGVMSIGIPMGLGVILFTIIITTVYVRRANAEFDTLAEQIAREAR